MGKRSKYKKYDLKFESRGDYLFASIDLERVDLKTTREYIDEIGNACVATRCSKLLIEKRLPNTLWVWDSVCVCQQFPRVGLSTVKVALVDGSVKHFGASGFGVSFGSDPCVDLQVVKNIAAGEDWLRE